jgi:Sigma-70, region 4
MLESLSPEQHAAFLLREVFDYPYDRMPEIVGKSEDNVRQLTARARRHVEERRPRYELSAELRDELARRSIAAARNGEVERLESPLSAAPPERVDTGPLRHSGAQRQEADPPLPAGHRPAPAAMLCPTARRIAHASFEWGLGPSSLGIEPYGRGRSS